MVRSNSHYRGDNMALKIAIAALTLLSVQACKLTINSLPECEEYCEAGTQAQSHILDVDYTTTHTPPMER